MDIKLWSIEWYIVLVRIQFKSSGGNTALIKKSTAMHGNGLPLELKIKNNYIKGNHYQLNQNNTRNKLITDSIHKIKTKTK